MKKTKPNIVLMYADDMGYGDFGAFNDGNVLTPNLDDLISGSTCLSQHYAGSPVCSPSRASLLTGRYPHRTGAITPQEVRGMDRIHSSETTIGDVFGSNGYATGLIGKWHNGALNPKYHPNNRGFQEFVGFSGGWADYYDWNLDINGSISPSDGRYLTDVLGDAAVDFIKRHASDPFLLMLPFNAPHTPLQAPEEITNYYEEKGLNRGVSLTYAMIQKMDESVGRVLQTLEDYKLADNTILMFTSDNGPAFSLRDDHIPKNGNADTTRFNCGFKGSKASVYEGGIRVPMIIRWPDGLPKGTNEITELVHFTDWLPTLMSAVGIEHKFSKDLDGFNILPQLRSEEPWIEPRRFWQWNSYQPVGFVNAAMRKGDWKLVRPNIIPEFATDLDLELDKDYVKTDIEYKYFPENVTDLMNSPDPVQLWRDNQVLELFNIREDPLESQNLVEKHPQYAQSMLKELETWFEQVNSELLVAQRETLNRIS